MTSGPPPCYEVVPSGNPRLGRIMRATRHISAGEEILRDWPLLTYCYRDATEIFRNAWAVFCRLGAEAQEEILHEFHSAGDFQPPPLEMESAGPAGCGVAGVVAASTRTTRSSLGTKGVDSERYVQFARIVKYNAAQCLLPEEAVLGANENKAGDNKSTAEQGTEGLEGSLGCDEKPHSKMRIVSALYPLATKANHSCAPNCHWYTTLHNETSRGTEHGLHEGKRRVKVMRAIQEIPAGAEILVSYLDPEQLYAPKFVRRELLRSQKGFLCGCVRCSSFGDTQKTSPCRGVRSTTKTSHGTGTGSVIDIPHGHRGTRTPYILPAVAERPPVLDTTTSHGTGTGSAIDIPHGHRGTRTLPQKESSAAELHEEAPREVAGGANASGRSQQEHQTPANNKTKRILCSDETSEKPRRNRPTTTSSPPNSSEKSSSITTTTTASTTSLDKDSGSPVLYEVQRNIGEEHHVNSCDVEEGTKQGGAALEETGCSAGDLREREEAELLAQNVNLFDDTRPGVFEENLQVEVDMLGNKGQRSNDEESKESCPASVPTLTLVENALAINTQRFEDILTQLGDQRGGLPAQAFHWLLSLRGELTAEETVATSPSGASQRIRLLLPPEHHYLMHKLTSFEIQCNFALGKRVEAVERLRQYCENQEKILTANSPATGLSWEEYADEVAALLEDNYTHPKLDTSTRNDLEAEREYALGKVRHCFAVCYDEKHPYRRKYQHELQVRA
ncbi:unnamed protein product [Amoebophrya sp. A120]|nr:unnamed protein product [Amoebophrya sp. A120]|eukprot:GSA120T00012073001.1